MTNIENEAKNLSEKPTLPLPNYPAQLLTDPDGTIYEPPIDFGEYQILQLVRRNVHTSIVCRGKRPEESTELAIKICGPHASDERFEREIDYTRQIQVSGVVQFDERDVGHTQCGRGFYATRWWDKPTLDQFLRVPNQRLEFKLNPVEDVCKTLTSLHKQNFNHRDIKPSNILVTGSEFSAESMRKQLSRDPSTLSYRKLVCDCLSSDPRKAPKDASEVLILLRACRGVGSRSANIWRPMLAGFLILALGLAWVQGDDLLAYVAKFNGKTSDSTLTQMESAFPPEVERIPDPHLIHNPPGTNQVLQLTLTWELPTAEIFSSTGERMGRMGGVVFVPSFTDGYVEVRASGYTSGSITFKPLNPEGCCSGKINLARQTLPKDLMAMDDAGPAPLAGLYGGSREAQEWQIALARERGLPLQVKTKTVGIEMRFVPSGSYVRGSPTSEAGRDDDESQHTVVLKKAFWVGRFPVTQRQWKEVMGSNPSYHTGSGLDAPVENVSHDQSQEFLNKLCNLLGVPLGTYRLLTEAEWEYACRAGTSGAYYGPLDDIAWYDTNSGKKTHPVGRKKPNAYGLYDFSGNVWEWCSDWYGTYPTGTVTDPAGPVSGLYRVNRGGGYWYFAQWARSAFRIWSRPVGTSRYLGLRIARTVE